MCTTFWRLTSAGVSKLKTHVNAQLASVYLHSTTVQQFILAVHLLGLFYCRYCTSTGSEIHIYTLQQILLFEQGITLSVVNFFITWPLASDTTFFTAVCLISSSFRRCSSCRLAAFASYSCSSSKEKKRRHNIYTQNVTKKRPVDSRFNSWRWLWL